MKSVQESEVSFSKGRSPHLVLSTNPVECEHENPPHLRRSLSSLEPHCLVLLFDQPFTIRFLKSEKRTGYTSLPEGCNVPKFSKKKLSINELSSDEQFPAICHMRSYMKSMTWQLQPNHTPLPYPHDKKRYFFNIFKTSYRQSSLSYWRLDLSLVDTDTLDSVTPPL